MTDPIEHAKAAMQRAFELFDNEMATSATLSAYTSARRGQIDLQFWDRKSSQTVDSRTVRLTSTLIYAFEQPNLSAFFWRPARHNIVHEAWHVVQAQGRSRWGWRVRYAWDWLFGGKSLEREADAMAIKYRDKIK